MYTKILAAHVKDAVTAVKESSMQTADKMMDRVGIPDQQQVPQTPLAREFSVHPAVLVQWPLYRCEAAVLAEILRASAKP